MLPAVAELGSASQGHIRSESYGDTITDAFDEASYGVWSTIMQTMDQPHVLEDDPQQPSVSDFSTTPVGDSKVSATTTITKPFMALERQERLEEFASAFLDVSVFDLAEVWLPIGKDSDCLGLVTSVTSTKSNATLNEFTQESEKFIVKYWSGAVGRAYSSGNPVWSFNKDVFADAGRLDLFNKAKIETALAVPVFSGKSSSTPAFVFCCYSFVRTGSVPFVLKFVQQALKLLWGGLDKVQPHESVGEDIWRDVAPADLGEMAADVEMQQHFIIKKRPIASISNEPYTSNDTDDSLAFKSETLEPPSGVASVRSIYTGHGTSSEYGSTDYGEEILPSPIQPIQYQTFASVQNTIHDAIKTVAEMQPYHQHVATNATGSKRAHVYQVEPQQSFKQQQQQQHVFAQSNQAQQSFVDQQQVQPLYMQTQQQSQGFVQQQQQSEGYMQQQELYTQQQQQQQPQQQQQQHQYQPQHYAGEQTTSSDDRAFFAAAPAPLPLGRPLPLPKQVVDSGSRSNSMSYLQEANSSFNSLEGFLQGDDEQQTMSGFHPVPDRVLNEGNNAQQQFDNHNPYGVTRTAPPPEPTPTPTYSVPMDQISAKGITFPVAPSASAQTSVLGGPNGMSQNSQFCMPVAQTGLGSGSGNGKRCRIQGCSEPAVSRRPYCVRHSGNRMCEQEGCSKCAQGSTRFCIAHGGGRRCTFPGCDKGARDKFFCAAHGGGKRCKFDGCNKSAVGGSSLCTAHGGGRRCSVEGCDKSAQSSTKFCVKHGGGKKCCHPGCEKVARGRTQYCAAHGGGVRCKLAGCNRVAIGKLQLCRAHGGGARPKNTSTNSFPTLARQDVPAGASFQQLNPSGGSMFGQLQDSGGNGSSNGNTMAHV
eukprot:CAMPEP_0178871214 /NCGR_PEP_ID=MMETSP0747-20121128/7488_1 /TAXON_ID=913974 /ORGANISM="Nitzschia punctata, Strain CCMP561" /LENGTH=869 /DNA_ID=CAMNT_0020538381 /DNA_START=1 /DNA_END=2609 /DNA_ORIENTATION=+